MKSIFLILLLKILIKNSSTFCVEEFKNHSIVHPKNAVTSLQFLIIKFNQLMNVKVNAMNQVYAANMTAFLAL